jgi:hypothetical protein
LRENKFKAQISAAVVVASVFWNSDGIFFVQFFKRRATINSERLSADIKEAAVMKSKFSAKEGDESSPPAPPPSPLYIPDSATSEFHLFDSLKEPLRGRRFADDDDICNSVRRRAPTLQQRTLDNGNTASHAKMEKVC